MQKDGFKRRAKELQWQTENFIERLGGRQTLARCYTMVQNTEFKSRKKEKVLALGVLHKISSFRETFVDLWYRGYGLGESISRPRDNVSRQSSGFRALSELSYPRSALLRQKLSIEISSAARYWDNWIPGNSKQNHLSVQENSRSDLDPPIQASSVFHQPLFLFHPKEIATILPECSFIGRCFEHLGHFGSLLDLGKRLLSSLVGGGNPSLEI